MHHQADSHGQGPPGPQRTHPAQLSAKWVDFRDQHGQDVSLNGVSLWYL